ncbi:MULTISPECIES: Appr-1-p processing protein [unclassified Streptomyces]|uniref:Appr-1-p processing protein n=1 Tax=unclassified Streptomyces TaxID=2593676 RepID=UPI001F037488|nr:MULTISPECIES: Appr-1-p processing protein [unclassified Streptomyces]MCH0563545.1 Appr-1-p processing protein [Streptomyces sp. MUM 2J]MCH0572478.1 Appr-1-p processing protein [Streptomyces sp. MUM 136J]
MPETMHARGDATAPSGRGAQAIAHVRNDIGGWGRGFGRSLSRRRPEPEQAHRARHRARATNDCALGAVRLAPLAHEVGGADMIGQRGVGTGGRRAPVHHQAIDEALGRLAGRTEQLGAPVQVPRTGRGPAGGRWSRTAPPAGRRWAGKGIVTTVHELREGRR